MEHLRGGDGLRLAGLECPVLASAQVGAARRARRTRPGAGKAMEKSHARRLGAGNGGSRLRGNDGVESGNVRVGDARWELRRSSWSVPSCVIAGLVPAIHGVPQNPMDHRDEPGGDGVVGFVFCDLKRRFLELAGMTGWGMVLRGDVLGRMSGWATPVGIASLFMARPILRHCPACPGNPCDASKSHGPPGRSPVVTGWWGLCL